MGEHSFRAAIVNRSGSYFVLIPARVSAALGVGRVPVVVQIDDGEPFSGTLMPVRGGGHLLMVNARARKGARSGRLRVKLRLNDPDRAVPIADDLAAALDEAGVRATWESFPPGKREHIRDWIERAAHESTRAKRVALAAQWAEEHRERKADRAAAASRRRTVRRAD